MRNMEGMEHISRAVYMRWASPAKWASHSGEMVFMGVYMRSVLSQSGELASLSRFETKYFNVLILNLSSKLRKFQLDFVSYSNNVYFYSSCHISGGVSYLDYAKNLPRRKAAPFLSSDCEPHLLGWPTPLESFPYNCI